MALTRAEAGYVDEMESIVTALKAEIGSSARRLIQRRIEVTKKADDEQYVMLYGEGVDDKLAAELAKIDKGIDALFTTGFVSQTRKEIESQFEAGNNPPFP